MKKTATPLLWIGSFISFYSILNIVPALIFLLIAQTNHIPFSQFLATMQIGKNDCLGLLMPTPVLFLIVYLFNTAVSVSGIGIIFSRNWGRILFLVLVGIELTWLAGDIFIAKKTFQLHHAIEIAIMTGLCVYLCLPQVRENFRLNKLSQSSSLTRGWW